MFARTLFAPLDEPKKAPAPTGPPSVDDLIFEMTPEEQMTVLRRVLGDDLVNELHARALRRRAQRRLAGEPPEIADMEGRPGGAIYPAWTERSEK